MMKMIEISLGNSDFSIEIGEKLIQIRKDGKIRAMITKEDLKNNPDFEIFKNIEAKSRLLIYELCLKDL